MEMSSELRAHLGAIETVLAEMLRADPQRSAVMTRLRQVQTRYAGNHRPLAEALTALIEGLESQHRIGA